VEDLGPTPFDGCDALAIITAYGMSPQSFQSEDDRISAALGFCSGAARYPAKTAAQYEDFVLGRVRQLAEAAVDRDLLNAAAYFTENRLLTTGDLPAVLDRAQKAGTMEIVSLLLDYRSRCLEKADLAAEFTLQDFE
jgi:hypothetical protein